MENTANDLARAVGVEIGIIDAVAELEADQLTDLKDVARRRMAELRKLNICYWDDDDIPDEVFEALKLYLAACSGKNFGKTIRDEPLTEAQTREARRGQLIIAASPGYSGSTGTATYF